MKNAMVSSPLLIIALLVSPACSFAVPSLFRRRTATVSPATSALWLRSNANDIHSSLLRSTPTWTELSDRLPSLSTSSSPVLTLYRDTNGWCPFCERVWLALEIKKLPYKESLVNLQNKPQWFLDMVPTGLVPAVLLHDDANEMNSDGTTTTPQRTLVWESLDILKALDDRYPDTTRLVLDDVAEYERAREVCGAATTAGVKFVYGGRNETLSDEDKLERRREFETALDELDVFMGTTDGPFLLGTDVSGADVEIVPVMERWRYQLPLVHGIDLLGSRPNIKAWFEGLDASEFYSRRVRGDEYSWTAVASTFLRLFSSGAAGDEVPESTLTAIARADEAAAALTGQFSRQDLSSVEAAAFDEAAAKLISNHEAVIADCTRSDPMSQKELKRVTSSSDNCVDLALRSVGDALLRRSVDDIVVPEFKTREEMEGAIEAVKVVAARLCVPRDMGGNGAKCLRTVLARTAEVLEGRLEVFEEKNAAVALAK